MLEGVWQHHQTFDGTYSFEDLVDIHELLDVKLENERRAIAWKNEQNKRNQHGH